MDILKVLVLTIGLFFHFSLIANEVPTQFVKLSHKSTIDFDEGANALKKLQGWATTTKGDSTLPKTYYKTHNLIFLKTHLARIAKESSKLEKEKQATKREWNRRSIDKVLAEKSNVAKIISDLVIEMEKQSYNHSTVQLKSLTNLPNAFRGTSLQLKYNDISFSHRMSKNARTRSSMWMTGMQNPYSINIGNTRSLISGIIKDKDMLKKLGISATDLQKILKKSESNEEMLRKLSSIVFKKKDNDSEIPEQKNLKVIKLFGDDIRSDTKSSTNYFDNNLFPVRTKFLKELGIKSWNPSTKCKDLSDNYSKPLLQGYTKACAGFAIASDLEHELAKQNLSTRGEVVSPWITYGHLRLLQEDGAPTPTCPALESIADSLSTGQYWEKDDGLLIDEALNALKKSFVCMSPDNNLTASLNKSIGASSYASIDGFDNKSTLKNIDFNFFKVLIDNNMPPMVGYSEDNISQEDWLKITSIGFRHVAVVVGYCEEGISPFDLNPKKYLILRDSLGKNARHYKVSADNLLQHLNGIWKIKDIVVK